jgi:hypothetical protein
MKEKLKYIPMNLFINIGSLLFAFVILHLLCEFNHLTSAIIASIYYIEIVLSQSKYDYLEDKIKKLEQK